MSIWLISIIAICAMVAGAAAYQMSGRRVNRRIRRRNWSEATDEAASSSPASASREVDDIDAYWGSKMPSGIRSWDLDAPFDEAEVSSSGDAAPTEDASANSSPRTHREIDEGSEESESPIAQIIAAQSGDGKSRDEGAPSRDDETEDPDRISLAEQTVGKRGCRLGAAYLTHLLENGFSLPQARETCDERALTSALHALKSGQPTRILEHGGVLHRVTDEHVALFEPLAKHVDHPQHLFHNISNVVATRSLYVILTGGEGVDPEATDHLPALLERFSVDATHLVVLQEDGTFHNHIEDQRHYVPAQIDAMQVPESFVVRMMGYAQDRLDEGEPEAALRTLGPLAGPLWQRATMSGELALPPFDSLLVAQVLNLLGVANRTIGNTVESINCFEAALGILRELQDYAAVHVLQVNLGTTLLQHSMTDPDTLRLATRHLQDAVRLDDRDIDAWMALGETFLARHEVERTNSLLSRATHAFEQAGRIEDRPEIERALERIASLQELRRSAEIPAVVSSGMSSTATEGEPKEDAGVANGAPDEIRLPMPPPRAAREA